MRNVGLRVSILLIAVGLVPGSAGAQVGFGVLGGGTVPSGSLSDVAASGWNAGGFISFGRGDAAFKVRVEGVYHDFGTEDVTSTSGFQIGSRTSAFAGTANLRWGFLEKSSIRPYAIGGLGEYHFDNSPECKSACGNLTLNDESAWKFGVNGGFGVNFGKGFSFFMEARYHAVFGAASDAECLVSSTQCSDKGTAQFIPISLGFTFRTR